MATYSRVRPAASQPGLRFGMKLVYGRCVVSSDIIFSVLWETICHHLVFVQVKRLQGEPLKPHTSPSSYSKWQTPVTIHKTATLCRSAHQRLNLLSILYFKLLSRFALFQNFFWPPHDQPKSAVLAKRSTAVATTGCPIFWGYKMSIILEKSPAFSSTPARYRVDIIIIVNYLLLQRGNGSPVGSTQRPAYRFVRPLFKCCRCGASVLQTGRVLQNHGSRSSNDRYSR